MKWQDAFENIKYLSDSHFSNFILHYVLFYAEYMSWNLEGER